MNIFYCTCKKRTMAPSEMFPRSEVVTLCPAKNKDYFYLIPALFTLFALNETEA